MKRSITELRSGPALLGEGLDPAAGIEMSFQRDGLRPPPRLSRKRFMALPHDRALTLRDSVEATSSFYFCSRHRKSSPAHSYPDTYAVLRLPIFRMLLRHLQHRIKSIRIVPAQLPPQRVFVDIFAPAHTEARNRHKTIP